MCAVRFTQSHKNNICLPLFYWMLLLHRYYTIVKERFNLILDRITIHRNYVNSLLQCFIVCLRSSSHHFDSAATDICLSAFYSALLNFLSQQGFMTYVRPLRILQLILRRFWVTSFPIRTGSRDSACLPSTSPARGPQRWLQSATKLLRKLKSYVSAFSLSNWVCLDFTFKATCVFSFISLWEIVCPLY